MSISRKFQRSKSKYTLSQKIISAVTAAGFIMQPFTAFAGEIVKPGGENLIKDNVANIWADRVVDKTAINVFNKFNLSANEIANMYFGTSKENHNAANLVNFVNDRIDINGTVNAIQNSQIGGNLFFLSKEGMAVGKSGVINTGSLYVMTPTPDFMKAVQTVGTEAPAEDANKYLGYITNITDPTKANAWEIIPVNTSGTITVLGKVNATNEVQMRAAKIGVGKNVDDQVVNEVASGDTVSAASITTGVTNFGDLVNIKGVDGAEDVKSGLTGELTATQTGSGDIVLSAYVDGATKENDLEVLPVVGATLGPIAETVENTFVEQDFNASVDVYGTVETTGEKGDININATAVNSNADFDEKLNDYKANNNDVAQLANVKAEVNIDGAVKAAEDVTVKAEAINRYIDNSGAFAKANIAIASGTPITGDIAYSVLNTRANVNIASGANVESEKGSVDIDAKAETLAASAASVTALKFKAAGGTTGANVPAVSVLYTGADNKANVTVEGNVKAAENISIDADADMKVDAENKMGIKGKMGNQFVVGVTVAGAENSASVDIKDEDNSNNVINAGNDLSVNANATSDFTSATSIKAPEASAMAVAVNVTDFNSNANVNIDTDLTTGNDLTVKADNIITDDNVIAESTIGSGKYVSAATQVVTGHVEQKKGEVKEFISGLAAVLGKGKKLPIGDEDEIPGLQLSEIFKAGATVTYSGQKHDSSVTIGKNASLKANEGKLDIGAMTKIEDAHITATGTTSSYNDAYPAELTVNAAVLVNNMDNSSSVVVADRDEGSADALKGKNGVSVNASTRFEYNRIKNMIQDVKDAANQIASAVGGLDGSIKNDFNGFIDTLNKQISTWESAFSTADETLATSDEGVLAIGEAATAGYNVLTALNNLNTMLDNSGSEVAADTKAAIQGASDLLTSALAFADPNSYGNFAASSASKGSSGDTSSIAGHHSSAVNGAGTVMVNTVNSVSKVEIGSNAVINADGKVELNAENYMKDVSLGGLNAVPLTNSGGGTAASIGATVNYSDFNTDTVVAVNNGAAISGGDINIAGSNEIDHVSVAGSAGMGPSDETESKGIVLNGMLSFVDGSSDILTVVDDGAELTANAQKQYTETVKDEETGEETEVTKTSEGNISISGHNDTNIVNVAAGLNLGSGSGAVGVGLAYNDFAVKNIAGVADVAEQIEGLYGTGTGDVTFANKYNKDAAEDNEGGISAYGFDVDAATEGSIQSVSVAASASKNDDTGEVSFFGKIKGGISNVENDLLGTGGKLDRVTGKIFGTESGKANDFFNMGSKTHGANGGGIKIEGGTSGKGGFMPSFSIAGSGSVSLNVLDNATEAIVDNAKITMNDGNINVTARDALYAGAYSGAAALQWKTGGSNSDKAVGFAGAAGVNDIDNVVKAVVKNSTITNAGEFNTMALSGGEQLALGLGLAVEKTGSTSGYSGNAAVSVNLIDHEVEALHENNTVEKADDVNVSAYARDIENTGGGSLGAGQQKVGVGATVGVAMLTNNITAGIKGGKYENVGNVDVEALNALQNITVGIAAGLTLPSGGSGASAVVEGAGVYNEVHNTTKASIEGSDISTISTADAETGNVNVIAQDVAIDESSLYEQLLADGLADGEEEIAKRMGDEFDISGKNELDKVEMGDAETELNKNKADNEKEETVDIYKLDEEGKTTGSSIITVAGGLAATTGKGSGGAAVAITDIENTYTADVKYADITADELDVDAGSNSNIVTVAGGIGAANKGSGVGSVSWNDVINTANVNIANSHINAQQTTATAVNQAQIVSVGGQISGAGKAAVGATLSYVGLDNTTKVNISTTDFDERTDGGTSVTAEANNTSDSYNIGAGVSAGGTASVSGTVVVTQTKGTAGAVMDAVEINNAKKVTASAVDDTDILSVIGGINISGKVAAGAGVAYTEIGGVSADKEKAEQHVTAEINNSTINTIDTKANEEKAAVNVTAKDEARVINVAIGIGGAGNVAVQGASATTLINKTTSAEIADTKIDEEGGTSADVTVDAQNDSEITSSADVAAAAGSGAGVGAGIAVNRIIQQTNAAVNGGTMNVNNLTVNANATPQITNIGVGVGVAGSGAGVTGSVAVNMIENNVTARIGSGATIVADGTVGVVATSDEQIANYAGQASVAGTGAAVGLSVSYNELTGNTTAIIDGDTTSVSASGGDALEVKDTVDDDAILDKFADEELFEAQDTLGNDRKVSEYNGVAVSASSTHAIKSFLVNGGVAGEGAAVNGTVNVNQIGGSTKAAITDADINTAGTAGDVNVIAHDYTNSAGLVGSASVAGVGAGVGLGSDTNTVSREVTAEVVGRTDSDGNAASVINAGAFNVEAEAQQGISSLTVGLGVGGIGAGVSNATSVALLKGKTTASVADVNITADSVDVLAKHGSRLNTLGVVVGAGGLGAGVGVGVSVLNENSETAAKTENSNITINDGTQEDSDVNINADNNTKVNYQLYSTGGAAAGVAGSIGVSNVNSKVNTSVTGTEIGGAAGKANDINIGAVNNIDFTNNSGSVAGGGVGVGVGVAVNTIDSQVNTSVNYSELNAVKDINVTAQENRTVNQMAVNANVGAAGSGGANIMITNVGSAVESTYGSGLQTDDDGNVVEGSSVNVDSIIKEANDAVEGNKLQDGYTMGVDVNTVPEIKAGKGIDNASDASKIEVGITGTEINAGNKVTAEAVADTNVSMDAVQAGGGVFANVSGTVGILDVNRNSIINISNTIINAKDLAVNTSQKGNSGLDIYQGGFGGAASIGAAYGSAASSGVNNINVSDSDFTVTNDIDINAKDESSTEVNAIGVTLSAGGAASIVVAQGTNDSSTTVNISDTDITADGNIDINAERQAKDENGNKTDSLSVSAIAGSGGLLFAGAGVGATANEFGTVGAVVTGGSNFTAGNAINITALNAPSVKAVTGAVAGSMVVSGAITVAEANIGGKDDDEHLETYVNISDGNSFTADSLTAEAKADAVQNVDMNGISVSAALWPTGSVQANTGGADIYSDVDVTVGENVFKGNQDEPAINLNINGINNVTQKVSAKGISVSTFVATGTNIAETNSVLNTHVTANGSQAGSNIETVDINADSKVTVDSSSRGDGGAIADISPYAAMVQNNIVTTTAAYVSGNWTVAGDMDVNALHENNIDINADALKASVVGLSGVHSDNDIKNDTSVNFNNANVTTFGSQDISARNTIDYDSSVTGSGYGVAQGAAVWAEDDITSDAEVNVNSSKLDAKDSIDINALTGDAAYNGIDKPESAVNKEVTIKSAGVVAGTYAESTDTITFTNNINVGGGSSIATVGDNTADDADITLTAADRTNFTDIVTADTQGGVIGAAGTKLTNNITRTNNINVGGTIDSNYDANFDAGDSSVLNLTLKSNAYNKTAAPLATNPSISGVVTQNSAIDFASGSTVKSFRNINAAAGVGDTTVAKESKTWRWVDGGVTGTGSISSTSDGTISSSDAVANTSVSVNGTLEAGKNHELDITIDYTTGGKKNMEAAFDKYGKEELELGELGEALKQAQEDYNNNTTVQELQNAIKELDALEDKQTNNNIVIGQLEKQLESLETQKDVYDTAVTNATNDLNTYIDNSLDAYNDTILLPINKVTKEEFVAGLESGDTKFSDYLADYKNKKDTLTDVTAKQTELANAITAQETEINSYTDYTDRINELNQKITELTAETKSLQDKLQAAIDAYDDALKNGIDTKTVNGFIFGKQDGTGEKDYVSVTLSKNSQWYKDSNGSPIEKIGMADYAASLLSRMDELIAMQQEYAGTDIGTAYSNELGRIQNELQALGLLTVDSEGNIGIAEGASTVPTIELKDLEVSGGNVNITGGTLNGKGTITANGTPSVTVTNNTDFFLRVNDVTVESDGGSVLYNNASVNTTNNKYNGITVNADKTDSVTGNNAQITIKNTTGTKASESTLYTPDIGIYGTIYNPYGNITITNSQNSIYVAGEVTDEDGNITQQAGSIKGRTINLTAGGAITQGYSDEIYHVAGDPQNSVKNTLLAAIQAALIEALDNQTSNGKYYAAFDSVEDLAAFLKTLPKKDADGEVIKDAEGNVELLLESEEAEYYALKLTGSLDTSKPGIAAAGAIYINAASINVNGTIQSGYESYKLEIDSDKLINGETLAELITNYQEPAGEVTTDYSDYMTDEYLVTSGSTGAYYDEDAKQFVYGVQAWYNPDTNEIFTEDIDQAGGGRIYLTGAIANTNANGGKLVVLDGGSNYVLDGSVDDANDFTFKLGSINADTVEGQIVINDTSSGKTVTTVYSNNISDKDKLEGVNYYTVTDDKVKYQPTTGLYYNWSNGTASRVITSYEYVSDSSWWGLANKSWEDVVNQMDQVTKDEMMVGNPVTQDTILDAMGNIIADGSTGKNGLLEGYKELGSDGSNSAKITGSTAKGDDTIYQISFDRKAEPKQGVDSAGNKLYWTTVTDDDGNESQVLTTDATTNGVANQPYYLKDADGKYIYETEISDKVTTTKKKGLLGLWGKTVTTTWKETSGMLTAYNFGVKADNKIGIEFVGNKDGSVGNITSNGNILLGGDINMGSVDIKSGGNISHIDDATVISDNASFSAATGIDVIQKNANNALHLNAVTNSGDINIQAVAANANDMVYIKNVSTGEGNVNITAEGSLLNYHDNETSMTAQTPVVIGDSINLQSYGGSIGMETDRLLIDGDVSYVANSDKKHGAISTNAAGSVYLTEVNGNMYLGEIVAENGDVVLEVKENNAGFVDAIENNSNGNKDDNRVAEWKKLGLLGGTDEDDTINSWKNQIANLEQTASNGSMFMKDGTSVEDAQKQGAQLVDAGKDFATLMQGGSDAVKAAREELNAKQGTLNKAIAALGNDDTSKQNYKDALEAYNSAYDKYETVGAAYEQQKANFIENSGFKDNAQAVEWLYNYEAIRNAEADNYGWTQQQLLYAVQDTVINPEAGSVSDVKTANVTGNNITFISNTGNLGVVDDQASSISSSDLTKLFTGELADEDGFLDKLASARAGDVTWGKDEITIKRTTPVSVKLNSDGGKVTVQNTSGQTADHVYLLAKDSVLNANEFAANDLRLSGQQGINVNKVTGDKIILEGGSGDIGHKVNDALQAVQVTLTNNGYVSANAAGNIILEQVGTGNFTLGSVAGTNVDITANGNIVSKADDIGYINASGTINLTSEDGGIGTTTKGLRIKNSGAVVNTDVQDAINIEAVQDGTLILGKMEQAAGGVNVDSEGSIMLGRENDAATTEDESVTGSIDAKGDVTLHAEDDIIISGKLHVNATDDDTASDNGTLQLHSNTGDIVQTTAGKSNNIVAANVGIAAVGGDVELDNPYNIIKNIDLQAVGGSLGLTVSNPAGFNVDMGGFTNKQGGDIKLTNSDGSVNITTEDIVDQAQKDPANINGSLTVTADKLVEETEANVNNYGILNAAGDISFNAEDNVNNKGALVAGRDADINFDAGNDVNNESAVNAGADVNFDAGNDVNNESTVSAGADVSFGAGNDVNNESTVNAGADVDFGAGYDVNNESTVKAGTDVSFGAGNDIINNDIVDAGRNVNFNAAKDIYNNSTVNADETIEFTAVDGVINSDTVNGKDVIMQAIEQELENILAKDSVTLNGDRIHGQNITQNTEADGDLIINTDSDSGSGPIESLVIDKIDANDKSVFTELWAVEADITTVDDKMDFNDIMIEENAWLENSGTLATIYGNVPVKDDDANVHIYQSYPSMYVNFIDADTVETDGRLLSLDDYWYAYDQRFTAENHLRWQHGRYLDEDWKQAYGYGLSLHNRYGLIDYQEFTETNAGADEVAVEA